MEDMTTKNRLLNETIEQLNKEHETLLNIIKQCQNENDKWRSMYIGEQLKKFKSNK